MFRISESSLDDLLFGTFEALQRDGSTTFPTRGEATEVIGATLHLSNPRARLSRSLARGRVFSAIGELCWYLAGSNELAFVEYYIPAYAAESENGLLHGAYGPRLLTQLERVKGQLTENKWTRRAVIQLFDNNDLVSEIRDPPCTCTLQFLIREDCLHLVVHMRSNDAYLGLQHDVFCFTMIQELVARELGLELGGYTHMANSLHLYKKDTEPVGEYLEEGYQSNSIAMPAMPLGSQNRNVELLLESEQSLRLSGVSAMVGDPYWSDMSKLLEMFAARKSSDEMRMRELAESFSYEYYKGYGLDALARMQKAGGAK